MQHKNNIHPVPKFLTFYRSCPLTWAKNEYYSSRKHAGGGAPARGPEAEGSGSDLHQAAPQGRAGLLLQERRAGGDLGRAQGRGRAGAREHRDRRAQ